jgi:hypothetical protein
MAKDNKPRGRGSRKLLRDYFLSNIGRVIVSDELQKASGGASEWGRRVRELRNEEGYQILTHNDRSDLKPGEYLLETAKPIPAFARQMSKETRAMVIERNGYTCQMCGAVAGEPHPYDPSKRTRLHIGHIIDKQKGGSDELSNLRALCSVCNEGAQNISPKRPEWVDLLVQIRRAPALDQVEALKWLMKKFPTQARANLSTQSE